MKKLEEPFFKEIPTSLQMTQAYNWYAENFTWKDSQKFIVEYLINKNEKIVSAYIKKLPESEISWACGWISRMLTNGSVVRQENRKYLSNFLERMYKQQCSNS